MTTPEGLPPVPTPPEDYECCGRGCDPCIFDYHDRAMTRWRARVRQMGADPDAILAQQKSASS